LLADSVFMTDRTGRIHYLGGSAEALFGYRAPEMVGRHIGSFMDPSVQDVARLSFDRILAGQESPKQMDLLMRRKDQTTFIGRVRADRFEDGLMCVVGDVSGAVTEERRQQERRIYQDRGLALLYLFTVQVAALPEGVSLHQCIARGLKEFTGARFVTISEYDPATKALRHRHFEMDPGLAAKAIALLGSKVEDLVTPLSDETYRIVTGSGWILERSLYEMTFGSVPRPVAAAIQKLLGIDRFIGLSFIVDGRLYGTSLIALMPGEPDPPQEVLQAYRHTSAIALRCRALEAVRSGA
jgi:PAS domain S-box-containing protein